MKGRVCHLQLLLALTSAVILRSKSHRTHDHILLSQIRDSPKLEGQVPVFTPPRNRVAQLYPKALGSLFVTSYNLQGYDGGIRTHLHTGSLINCKRYLVLLITPQHGPHRKPIPLLQCNCCLEKTYSIVVCAATDTDCTEITILLFLFMGHCLVTVGCCDSTILALSEYATIL
jgi:hypothetical protein